MARTLSVGESLVGEGNEVHRGVVDVESLVVELHEGQVGHDGLALRPMSNHTRAGLDRRRGR